MININIVAAVVIGIMFGLALRTLKLSPQFGMSLLLPLYFVLKPETLLFMLIAIYMSVFPFEKQWCQIRQDSNKSFCTQTFLPFLKFFKLIVYNPQKTKFRLANFSVVMAILLAVSIVTIYSMLNFSINRPQFLALAVFCITAVIYFQASSTSSKMGNNKKSRFLALFLSIMSALIGLIIPTIGMDVGTGAQRYSMGITELYGGIDFTIMALGLCCIGEILYRTSGFNSSKPYINSIPRIKTGLLNIFEITLFILVLAFGIPCSEALAIIAAVVESYGTAFPQGCEVILNAFRDTETSTMNLTILAVVFIAWLFPTSSSTKLRAVIKIVYKKLKIPNKELSFRVVFYPIFTSAAFIGAYSINYRLFDMLLLIIFGFFGFAMRRLNFPVTPLIICAAFGSRIEKAYRADFVLSFPTALFYFLSALILVAYIKKALNANSNNSCNACFNNVRD